MKAMKKQITAYKTPNKIWAKNEAPQLCHQLNCAKRQSNATDELDTTAKGPSGADSPSEGLVLD